jgi:hypothetical protein
LQVGIGEEDVTLLQRGQEGEAMGVADGVAGLRFLPLGGFA